MNKPTLSTEQKEGIASKLAAAYRASGFPSRSKYAVSVGITSTDFSNITTAAWKKNDQLVSVQKWLRLAHALGYEFKRGKEWITASTATYRFITAQLKVCKSEGLCAILADHAAIGKTHTAREFCATQPNAFYVHGGNFPRKVAFIRALATSVGINPDKSTVEETLQDVITYLKSLDSPVIVVDEAGDLHNNTYLLLKRLYNELEFVVGIYLIGGPGLKKRIDAGIRVKTNGFEELFSRFGDKYSTAVPQDIKAAKDFLREEARLVATQNGFTDNEKLNKLLTGSPGLRRVRTEVIKHRSIS